MKTINVFKNKKLRVVLILVICSIFIIKSGKCVGNPLESRFCFYINTSFLKIIVLLLIFHINILMST
jgi:hypothetical protein